MKYQIYQPSEDSYLLSEVLKQYCKKKSVLDMGSGSGILAETAIKAKAKSVLAVDINSESIKLLSSKFKKNKKIKIIKSNLFSKIPKNKKFDIIVFNPPYLPLDKREPLDSRKATTGGKKGDEIILRFLKQAKHLSKDGLILLLTSSLTPEERIIHLLKSLKLNRALLSQKKLFMETLFVWKIENSETLSRRNLFKYRYLKNL